MACLSRMKHVYSVMILLVLLDTRGCAVSGFLSASKPHPQRALDCPQRSSAALTMTSVESRADDTTKSPVISPQEEKVYALLTELSNSRFAFRIVVVGNGAILESTNMLGPTLKLSQSPATGANLATFASDDQSFEFHLVIAQVSKVAMVEKASPVKEGKMMRILRFLNNEEKPICSLILAEESTDAAEWYKKLLTEHGPEMIFY
ncbi:hypothetical protein IV203_035855 [Nitzschia inconspicua]|uniref:Uncharacterized protein n=1 Tax=Nitzschia inconspicua TaxID=303405 RepID=A0A9K3LGZ6_9STRA|nr:hypothetical protein IV203_035855 [Nitzschia inconspicua]